MPNRPCVLLVDDVEANLLALEASLGDVNFELVRAQNGQEALRYLLKREFAVMLLDVQMPEMDGYEVAKYARANPATRDVPIIFLTAMHDTPDAALRAYGSGAVDFLLKPINSHVLLAKVHAFIDLYLSRQKLADEVQAHQRTLSALQGANAALRHFTNAASHDLRAPIRAIRGMLDALDEHAGGGFDDEARRYLSRATKASDRMTSLLNSLLAYAGLQKPAAVSAVNCDVLVEQVRTDLARDLSASNAVLKVGPLPTVTGDTERLYQLFLNLVANANKFRRPAEPPCIVLSAEERGQDWLFSVEDNGIGVDSQYADLIFESFQRLHSQEAYEGSGLGLMICRQIVEQHGGRIWLGSESGNGCRFHFTLSKARGTDGKSAPRP